VSRAPTRSTELPIVTLGVQNEADLVILRQRARLVAQLLGFRSVDQTRVATAVSEIGRNALRYGGGGRARILVGGVPQALVIRVEDRGPGFVPEPDPRGSEPDPALRRGGAGIVLARRLMDDFEVTSAQRGSTVRLAKKLPAGSAPIGPGEISDLVDEIVRRPPESLLEELHQQQQELLALLEDLTRNQDALRGTNAELEETNRGVMALYAEVARELDDTNRGVLALYAQLDDQAAELRRLNALKDRFLSHLSHEFRTPLNATLALSQLLLDRADGPLTDEQEVQVRFIHGGAGELLAMVNDLLDLAKIEAGRMDVRSERVDLVELVGTLRGMFRPLAAGAGLQLRIEEPPPELAALWTDQGKLSQVLRNLLSNAINYTERGEVRLETAREGDSVLFTVSDTGVGIPQAELERVFEDYVQARAGRPSGAKGTGLGLPLARELTTLLGGIIEAESRPGEGSTFRVRVPLVAPPATEGQGVAEEDRESEGGTSSPTMASGPVRLGKLRNVEPGESPVVLVIDDEESSRYLVEHMLEPSGCTVVHAATAREGLEQVRRVRPAAVFLDLGLPDRSGFEVLNELKGDPAAGDIPIIIYTSRQLDSRELRGLSGVALRVVRKSDPTLAATISGIGEALVRAATRLDSERS
jgi:signal transduction histidine kinase/CheY-like chemotaxis protein